MDCREMIVSEDFYDILLDYPPDATSGLLTDETDIGLSGIPHCSLNLGENFAILYLERSRVRPLNVSNYRYAYIPKCYALLQQEQQLPVPSVGDYLEPLNQQLPILGGAYEAAGITAMQQPPFSLTGRDILLGFIDTGIRYTMEAFQYADGTSKILSIWDQTDQTGTAPGGLIYGTEYTREMINEDLRRRREGETEGLIPHRDENGHGTQCVSVALNGAPDAQVIMVKCREAKNYLKEYYAIPNEAQAYAESDIMAGLAYLEQVAEEAGKPIVICITMGTNMGDHRGNSLLARYLQELGARRKHCIVIGGGNEGNSAHHYEGRLMLTTNPVYEDVEIRVSENVSGFSMELRGAIPGSYTISIQAPDGETAQRIPIRYGMERNLYFVYSRSSVYVSYVLVERNSGEELIFMRFLAPSPGIWTIRVFAEDGYGTANYHMWLPVKAFLNNPVYFLRPDPELTITEPAYSDNAIGLSYYNWANNSFAIDSGRGGRRTTVYTPAMSAAGVDVDTVSGPADGSSIAAALMTGAAAQFMQWAIVDRGDMLLSSTEVRNYFIRGAERNPDLQYPNSIWGYGRMNIQSVFQKIVEEI